MATKNYDSESIQNLGFPASVRAKPGMYMGEMGSPAIWQCIREIADNCVDECLAGHASQVEIVVDGDTFHVIDNGRGIPSGMTRVTNAGDNKVVNVPTLRAVFGVMHTSGKFNDHAYKVSRGSHGAGAKGSNALSRSFSASTYHGGKWSSVSFKEGALVEDAHVVRNAPAHPVTASPMRKGTIVTLSPDYKIIGKGARLSLSELTSWCQIAAYFTPGMEILAHLRKEKGFVSKKFYAPNGPRDYITDRVQVLLKGAEFSDVVEETFVSSGPLHDCVLRFTTYDGCDTRSFTNGLINTDGGTHLQATFAALKDSLTPYLTKKQSFTVNEIKDGLIGLINIKMSEPKFASQTKDRLVDERGTELKAILQKDLDAWLKANKKIALALVDRASRLKEMKTRFTASKQTLAALKKISKKGLPAMAATAPRCKPEDRDLFLLEGASAAGGLRFARFEEFQEFLPLKGKPRNLVGQKEEKKASETSQEVLNILAMLGVDPKLPDPVSKLRVGKIIVMADGDSDGYHVQTLIFGILYRYVPEVFDRGMVYVTCVPEYYSLVGNVIYSGDSLEEVQGLLSRDKVRGTVNHVKGYGEVDSSILRVFACDPKTRRLLQVKAKSFERFELLMGNDSSPRKQLLGL